MCNSVVNFTRYRCDFAIWNFCYGKYVIININICRRFSKHHFGEKSFFIFVNMKVMKRST